jgi:hypothetical protein
MVTGTPDARDRGAELGGGAARFTQGVKRPGLSQDEARLVAFIADALQKHMHRDAGIKAACDGLQHAGMAVLVRLELTPGDAAPRVTVPGRPASVPQWSEEDSEILRSLGIASDTSTTPNGSPSEPGRHHPR